MTKIISLNNSYTEDYKSHQENLVTPENTTPNTVLSHALDKLNTVLIIGKQVSNNTLYIASSSDDVSELNLLIDLAKKRLFELLLNSENTGFEEDD